MKQEKLSLNKNWYVCPEAEGAEDLSAYLIHQDDPTCRCTDLPALMKDLFPKAQTPLWYYKSFFITKPDLKNHRLCLCFDRVVCLCQAWINGVFVGKHNHSEEKFEFDVTDAIKEGENHIALRVYGPVADKIGPDGISMQTVPNYAQIYSYYTVVGLTGIYGEITLRRKPLCAITDLYVNPDPLSKSVTVELTLENHGEHREKAELQLQIYEKGSLICSHFAQQTVEGQNNATAKLTIPMDEIRLWSPDDPYLYTLHARVSTPHTCETAQKRFGFKTLCVEDGWFILNGKRIFLTCAHALESKAAIVHAKTMGFKALRYLSAMPSEEILDFCDEIGMMVYEECAVAWGMHDYPQMPLHMSEYLDHMLRRDRSHVSVGIWGIFNEQAGPNSRMRSRKLADTAKVFDFAVSYLPQLRRLDPTRLILLSSGRWDARGDIGSFSNPHSQTWNCLWGGESPDFPQREFQKAPPDLDPYIASLGDNHLYPTIPLQKEVVNFIRNMGRDSKPMFLSEYGVGYQLELYDLYQDQLTSSHEDHPAIPYYAVQIRHLEEWIRHYGLEGVYPTPRDFLMASIEAGAKLRKESMDPIRANPRLCGYSFTSFSIGNEGVYYRNGDLIPGMVDAVKDSFAPLKWAIFPEKNQLYAEESIKVEFVLCNEDALPPGNYQATVALCSRNGVAFREVFAFSYPEEKPLAATVVQLQLPGLKADTYTLSIHLHGHRQPACSKTTLCVYDLSHLPPLSGTMFPIGELEQAPSFLQEHGMQLASTPEEADVILVGHLDEQEAYHIQESVFAYVKNGKTAYLLDGRFFKSANTSAQEFMGSIDYRSDQSLDERSLFGECIYVRNWLYHMDSFIAEPHIFAGLSPAGLLDMDRFRHVYPDHYLIHTASPNATYCASFGSGLFAKDSCIAALTMGKFSLGKGSVIVSTFKLLENAGRDPVADRILYNLLSTQ